jgi:exodeoxyribonuclease VII large subunit
VSRDLFSSAERARREGPGGGDSLAQRVALLQLDGLLPGPGGARDWSVAEVNGMARSVVEAALPPVWVVGEVAGFTRARSGHCYFSLRGEEAQLRCVMWRDEARRMPTSPAEGMQVRALGRLTVYEARGEFQLVVAELQAEGEGLWRLAFDRLRAALDADGSTSPTRKRPLPRVPRCVGVVTSLDGAALHDVVTVVRRRAPWTRIVVAGCRVQGEGSAAEIATALRRMAAWGGADVVIVGRGGGSREDLWSFNEEAVARAIVASPVPVVSAVGHETDVTIADLVADGRAPTPSAAAELVVPDGAALRRELRELRAGLAGAIAGRLDSCGARVDGLRSVVRRAMDRQLRARKERLGAAAARLDALSPLATLGRGYALALGADRRVLRRADAIRAAGAFRLKLADGEVDCTVAEGGRGT